MNPRQGHHGAGAVGANGKKVGGQFQAVAHATSDDIFFGARDTLVLPRRQTVQPPPAKKTTRTRPAFSMQSMTRGARLAGAGVMATGGFVATTAGTAMATTAYMTSAGLSSGAAFLVVGIVAVAASVKTADAAL